MFQAVLFFHSSIVEKGLLTRCINEGYRLLLLPAILNFLSFKCLIYDKTFSKKIPVHFFLYWTEYLFMLYLYPVLWVLLYRPPIYTTLAHKIELKWNATSTILWLVYLTCYSLPWPFKTLLFYGAVRIVLTLVFCFLCCMKIYFDLTSYFFGFPKVFFPMVQATITFIPFSLWAAGLPPTLCHMFRNFVSKTFS